MLSKRIDILRQGNVISEQTATSTKNVIKLLIKEYPQIEEEKAEMFTTHLALAAQRISKNQMESEMDAAVLNELFAHSNYHKATILAERIYEFYEYNFPKTEKELIIIHLCNMLSN